MDMNAASLCGIACTALLMNAQAADAPSGQGFVSIKEGRFVDAEGRHLLLHGMSVINKSKKQDYVIWQQAEDFTRMRHWGMNCIRLGVLWDGLEPEPGQYNEAYLKHIDQWIAWAKANGLYVFLDMHQDLFSVLYSDGAPEWATLTDGQQHLTEGGVWSDAYFTSPAVQAAFDNFWANKSAPDGAGLQDHFARVWRLLAERYAKEPTVIGYDLFNEPNMGNRSPEAMIYMIAKFSELLQAKGVQDAPDAMNLLEMWGSTEGRSKLMEQLRDMRIYQEILGAIEPIYNEFERTQLVPMYQRVANAIREVDAHHIIFLETSMASNMGVRSGIEPILGPDGKRDPLQAYAPHGYDIVVDTPDLANASTDRIEFIFNRHAETAQRLAIPMLVGEWGAYGGAGKNILPTAHVVVRQFENHLNGETYWEYGRDLLTCRYQEILQRPLPLRISGKLLAYQSDPKTRSFTCTWEEDPAISAPTQVYLPEAYFGPKTKITLESPGTGYTTEVAGGPDKSLYMVIPSTGQTLKRTLSLTQ
ncbi:MAG TPA: cellulase family glycosylhydrolase [Candidatus Hydrogenedentes bacterium]|nr:cellulase family glycosylhydrolase [Candidatus Hydrogenedentota bacterium]